jgi:signal transduction histidine kinase/CheY-like chemotaxis protein
VAEPDERRERLEAEGGDDRPEANWRDSLVQRLFVATAAFSSLGVLLVSLTIAKGPSKTVLLAVGVPVCLVFAIETWLRRLSWMTRSVLLVVGMFTMAMLGYAAVGILAGPAICVTVATVSAGVLLGRRGLMLLLGATAVGIALIGTGMVTRVLPAPSAPMDSAALWIRSGSLSLFLLTLLSVALTFLVERLERAIAAARRETHKRETAEREREAAQAQVVQAQKLEAVGRLAASVAHDFNNLLAVVGTSAELLLRRLPAGARERADVEVVREAVAGGAALTRQLLTFARRRAAAPEIFDPGTRVLGVQRLVTTLVGSAVKVRWDVAEGVGPVEMDPSQLEQIVMNLAANARDAMPQGGVLEVSVAAADVDGRPPGVLLRVADSGVGMNEATRARVFEPFFTTKPEGHGTGLGMSTVQYLVQQAGGRVTLDSAPGRGTIVEVWLPRSSAALAPRDSGAASPPLRERPRLLVVDDEERVRDAMREILVDAGYEVSVARSGDDALAVAKSMERLDLLITDLSMPGMTGRELIARLRAARPGLEALLVSGFLGRASGETPLGAPEVAHLDKPFSAAALVDKVAAAVARR